MKSKIAIIGLGKIAADQHIPSIEASDAFELAAIVSSRGTGYGGLPVFRSAAELFEARPDVTVVAICTPPGARYDLVRKSIEAGRDVLMEKPPTRSLTEFQDLISRASVAGRVLFQTWHAQHNAAVDTARELLAAEGIASLHVDWRENVNKWHPGQDWVWEPGGFGVFDPGINALSILAKIVPFPLMVDRAEFRYLPGASTPAEVSLRFKSNEPHRPEMGARFDWLDEERENWTVSVETCGGHRVELRNGGSVLVRDGIVLVDGIPREYPSIYARFAELLRDRRSEVDDRPLRWVVDAFLVAVEGPGRESRRA